MNSKPIPEVTQDQEKQFWGRVNKEGPVIRPELGNCWIWLGAYGSHKYGSFNLRKGKPYLVHRIAYMLTHGPIGSDLEIDHLCNNRSCLRPSHLEAVTRGENVSRTYTRDGHIPYQILRPTCPKGHQYTAIAVDGARRCRECENAQRREARAAQGKKSRRRKGRTHEPTDQEA